MQCKEASVDEVSSEIAGSVTIDENMQGEWMLDVEETLKVIVRPDVKKAVKEDPEAAREAFSKIRFILKEDSYVVPPHGYEIGLIFVEKKGNAWIFKDSFYTQRTVHLELTNENKLKRTCYHNDGRILYARVYNRKKIDE